MATELFEKFILERGLAKATIKSYRMIINNYCKYHNMTLEQLFNEADEEEIQGIRWKDRKLKKRLLSYRAYLHNTKCLNNSTIKRYMTILKTVYSHFEIEIGQLPSLSSKNIKRSIPITVEDVPTKDDIKLAMELASNNGLKALIHFMSATGLAKVDALGLKVGDLLDGCKSFYNTSDISNIVNELSVSGDVIATLKLVRRKTNKFFFTFCTPEAVNTVAKYLMTRNKLELDSPLFDINPHYCYSLFRDLNDKMGKSTKNGWGQFRSHMLRKFHAKQLFDAGMSIDDIDTIQGRSKDKTHEAYFVLDVDVLRDKYLKHMTGLLLFSEVEYKSIESDEYKKLKNENQLYKDKIDEQDKLIKEINKNQNRMKELLGL